MGFFNSLSRELGRNTGKRISNAVFGDKWSTPYRIGRTRDSKQPRERKLSARERRELKRREREYRELDVAERRARIRAYSRPTAAESRVEQEWDREQAARNERERRELSQRYNGKISSLTSAAIPKSEDKLVDFMRSLALEFSTGTGGLGMNLRERALRVQVRDIAIAKFSQAYSELEMRYPRNPLLFSFYCTKIKLFFGRNPWKWLWKLYVTIFVLSTFSAIMGSSVGIYYQWLLVVPMAVLAVVPFCLMFLLRALRIARYRRLTTR